MPIGRRIDKMDIYDMFSDNGASESRLDSFDEA